MATRIFTPIAILLTALLAPPPGLADTTIRLDGSREAANTVIQVKGNLARLAPSGQTAYVIFDKGRNLAIYVDTARKTYTEVDRPTLEKYAGMASALRQQLQAQLQLLPPAQRALFEQRMGGLMGIPRENGLPDLDTLRSVARGTRVIGGFHCQLHLLLKEQQAVGDVCLSTAAEAGVSPADFATLMAMMDFMRQAAGMAQELTGGLTESTRLLLSGLQGVPVAARDYQSRQQFMVAGVSGKPLDAGLFNAYRGYRRQDLMEAIPLGQ
jgi:hypothetical protein